MKIDGSLQKKSVSLSVFAQLCVLYTCAHSFYRKRKVVFVTASAYSAFTSVNLLGLAPVPAKLPRRRAKLPPTPAGRGRAASNKIRRAAARPTRRIYRDASCSRSPALS